jgi:hypothetical protein
MLQKLIGKLKSEKDNKNTKKRCYLVALHQHTSHVAAVGTNGIAFGRLRSLMGPKRNRVSRDKA